MSDIGTLAAVIVAVVAAAGAIAGAIITNRQAKLSTITSAKVSESEQAFTAWKEIVNARVSEVDRLNTIIDRRTKEYDVLIARVDKLETLVKAAEERADRLETELSMANQRYDLLLAYCRRLIAIIPAGDLPIPPEDLDL